MRKSDLNKKKCVHRKPHCGRSGFEKNSLRNQGETRPAVCRSVAKGEPLRKAIIRSAARREVRGNGPQIKLGLLRPAGKFPSLGAKPRQSAKIGFRKEPELRTSLPLPVDGSQHGLLARSAAFGGFRARRSDGRGDALEAGRHPPADGWTPETDTQRAIAAEKLPLRSLHTRGPGSRPQNRQRKR